MMTGGGRDGHVGMSTGAGDADGAPLVSVVIPCHGQAEFLPEAVASARRQRDPVEVLVVDDGSPDATARVAAEAGVACLRQPHRGLPAARNLGLQASRGACLVFLDADDRLLPGALEHGTRALDEAPAAAFAAGHYREISGDGTPRPPVPQRRLGPDPFESLLRGNAIVMHATVMYRRGPLTLIGGFDETLKACEDYDVFLRLARRHPVVQHRAVVAEYRRHGAAMSRDSPRMLGAALEVLKAQERWVDERPRWREAYETGLRGWREHYARSSLRRMKARLRRGEPRSAIRELVALLRAGGAGVVPALWSWTRFGANGGRSAEPPRRERRSRR